MLSMRISAGIFSAAILLAGIVRATPPTPQCRDEAAHCREAFNRLDKCKHGKDGDKADACTAERTAADSACKMSNSTCVLDGSMHVPPDRKD